MATEMLTGMVAVVTGAASGIGRATAALFAEHGARVVAVDIAASLERDRLPGVEATHLCDVSNRLAVEALTKEIESDFGRYDLLVNAAGALAVGKLGEASDEEWDRVFAVNARGPWLMCQAALPLMVARRSGVIVNVASAAGLRPTAGLAVYSASKAALVSMTRSIACEYGEYGVRANTICPGMIDTPMARATLESRRARGEDPEFPAALYAIKRIGRVEEVAAAALFLASPAAAYVTGAALAVDAGRALH
ncbi:MAG: SDR family NAD(P)-dependent oxidoreductase [Stellaceae bacterium]